MTLAQNQPDNMGWWLLSLAWSIALVSTLSALFIGEILGQMPCVLCWYQRICMFPLALILGIAALRSDMSIVWYTLPLALIGTLIAAYHSLTYAGYILTPIVPCGQGTSCTGSNMTILGGISLPYLSLAAFTAVSLILCTLIRKSDA
ncbi:disulfide bond formation protein B [Amphritea balenae]|uniref:Disulfide bond formation protein B n=1 Tax=Amphritea balenae TaxID=452629 RepID=A0A3P1SX10_9GAMM|nr:disulfide bond formation protein B [Amphritea balenae]RRD01741.1 disulfide bond formation protein B [Amphritea balenae]GGK54440.1 disulfide bond formation protein C [Amphritea balenae]